MRKAVVVGAQGVIGRYIVEKLASLRDWQVVGLSRRKGSNGARVRHIPVDLLDSNLLEKNLQSADLADASHAFYAAICKELGLPLRFPGKPGAFRAVYQVTESGHMANAALWAAGEPRCANQAYNITNGDYFRWCNVWPRIAAVFEMASADPQT